MLRMSTTIDRSFMETAMSRALCRQEVKRKSSLDRKLLFIIVILTITAGQLRV